MANFLNKSHGSEDVSSKTTSEKRAALQANTPYLYTKRNFIAMKIVVRQQHLLVLVLFLLTFTVVFASTADAQTIHVLLVIMDDDPHYWQHGGH